MIKIMIVDSKRLMKMIKTWTMMTMNPEKMRIQMTVDKEQISRKRKVNRTKETLKTVMILRITIIKLIINKNESPAKRNMTLKMENKEKCLKAMIGTKRRKTEIITRNKRDTNKK